MPFPFLNGYGTDATVVRRAGQDISCDSFLAGVVDLRKRLPATRYVLNLCETRYGFATAFAAALTNGQITLLPPDARQSTLRALCARYESVAVIGDAALPPLTAPVLHWEPPRKAPAKAGTMPLAIDDDRVAVVIHTSGSSGAPRPHPKTWGALVRRARAVGRRLDLTGIDRVAGTVPSQHMYGLENAIILPLQHGLAVESARPFFPADVAAVLAAGAPALLVATPIHLKALCAADIGYTGARLILSSTAALPIEQARVAEAKFRAPAVEIYGSTETGVVATRRTVESGRWRLLEGLRLRPGPSGMLLDDTLAAETIELHDTFEPLGGGEFRLGPRRGDMIKIAGKRASLAGLNAVLRAVPGVEDGVFFEPRAGEEQAARLVAFVVAPRTDEADIVAALRAKIDPAFLPRPLVKIAALPRNAVGKLPRRALQDLLETAGRATS